MIEILYGTENYCIDVTKICYNKLKVGNNIIIPYGDINRANVFSDPVPGIIKYIYIKKKNNDYVTYIYSDIFTVKINSLTNIITCVNDVEITNKIKNIQSMLSIKYGSFMEELPEQKMVVNYLKGNEHVLEIGGNIGRNSLVISFLLKSRNMVVLESDYDISMQLNENKKLNNMNFHIEAAALSKRKLMQKNWDTVYRELVDLKGAAGEDISAYKDVNIISFEELNEKYKIKFDTLVLDCEGAFYYILNDFPQILENIKLIIMENDYRIYDHYIFVKEKLLENNFEIEYSEAGGWGPCQPNFFEVWTRMK